MRISDWSSDVCSSDLDAGVEQSWNFGARDRGLGRKRIADWWQLSRNGSNLGRFAADASKLSCRGPAPCARPGDPARGMAWGNPYNFPDQHAALAPNFRMPPTFRNSLTRPGSLSRLSWSLAGHGETRPAATRGRRGQ